MVGKIYIADRINGSLESGIIYGDDNPGVLAIFPNTRTRHPSIRAVQDELPVFYLDRHYRGVSEWYKLNEGEEMELWPGDEYGIGLPGDHEPSVRRWVVRQKSH